MPSKNSPYERDVRTIPYRTYLHWHFAIYFTALIIWVLASLFAAGDWSAFWPMITWSLAIMVHYLAVRSINIDAEWIEKRTDQVTDEAKDTSHIENIRNHYVHGVRPKGRISSSMTNENK